MIRRFPQPQALTEKEHWNLVFIYLFLWNNLFIKHFGFIVVLLPFFFVWVLIHRFKLLESGLTVLSHCSSPKSTLDQDLVSRTPGYFTWNKMGRGHGFKSWSIPFRIGHDQSDLCLQLMICNGMTDLGQESANPGVDWFGSADVYVDWFGFYRFFCFCFFFDFVFQHIF